MRFGMRLRPLFAALCLAFVAVAGLGWTSAARAQVEVDVNQGAVQPLPVAIPSFVGGQVGADIAKVIAANLDRSGLFRPLDPSGYPEQNLDVNLQPKFDAWKTTGAQALINGQATVDPDGRLRVDLPPVGRGRPAAAPGPAVHLHPRQLAAGGAQDLRRRLREADRRGRLFRHPRGVRGRERAEDKPGQAPGDHGPGRRQPELPDRRLLHGHEPALLGDQPGDHLHGAAAHGGPPSTS